MLNVLFLYKNYEYNYSKFSLVSPLRKHGINLIAQFVENKEQAKQHYQACDLLLINPELFWEELKDSKNCVALSSDIDGGWCPHINLIPYVNGTIESYAYLPRSLHNLKYYCYNQQLLFAAGYPRKTLNGNAYAIPEFSARDLHKIHVFCGFGSWERMKDFTSNEIDLTAERTNPILFAGTVEYAGTEIEEHRLHAVKLCNELGGIGLCGRPLDYHEYRAHFLKTKAILSPWGWGEACHRDFEALAFGCVLIKPDWSFVESFPDISSHNAPYIPCRINFADVPDILNTLINNWDKYLPLRVKGIQLARQALNYELNAKRFAEILNKIVQTDK